MRISRFTLDASIIFFVTIIRLVFFVHYIFVPLNCFSSYYFSIGRFLYLRARITRLFGRPTCRQIEINKLSQLSSHSKLVDYYLILRHLYICKHTRTFILDRRPRAYLFRRDRALLFIPKSISIFVRSRSIPPRARKLYAS